MDRLIRFFIVLVIVTLCAVDLTAGQAKAQLRGFIPNQGQWSSEVLYLHKAPNLAVWITRTGIVFDQYAIEGEKRKGHVLRLSWEGVNPASAANFLRTDGSGGSSISEEITEGATRINVFKGREHASWLTNMAVRSELRFTDLYPGIDLIYYLDAEGRMRYDFDVKPHADVDRIGFTVKGDRGVQIGTDEVILKTSLGGVNMSDLYAYVLGRKSMNLHAMFTARSQSISFTVPQWTKDVPMRIDPVVYGTYIGGPEDDIVKAVRRVSDGVVVAGTTTGMQFPEGTGEYVADISGGSDAFIAKLSADLSTVIAYTYFGGQASDVLTAMTVDINGKVCFTGTTTSSDLPVSSGAIGQLYKAGLDAFVARLSGDLATLDLCTYIGGNKDDVPMCIVSNNSSSIFVGGGTTSNANFPVTLAHQSVHGGQEDAFLARLSENGGSFVFCTYYGKSGIESFKALTLDNAGYPFVTGSTTSSDFETAPTPGFWASGRVPFDRTYNGGNNDAFIIKFFADGTLSKRDDGTFATFFGGDKDEEGRAIYVDDTGKPVVVGVTNSTNLPAVGTIASSPIGGKDLFMAVLTEDGRSLSSCTYFGGTGDDDVRAMIADLDHNAGIVVGSTSSTNFPTEGTGSSPDRSGPSDGFIATFNTSTMKYSTLVGGNGNDAVISVDVDDNGDLFYIIEGNSMNLPVGPTSWESEPIGGTDGYVAKLAYGGLSLTSPSGGELWCSGTTKSITWSALDMLDDEQYSVEVSADGGQSWTMIADKVTKTSHNWALPTDLEDGSDYQVRVKTLRGHVSGSNNFTVAARPTIVTAPQAALACMGDDVVLSVEATGTGLSYQWRRNGSNINGATTPTYTISAVSAGNVGKYDVIVSGRCTPSVTSPQVNVDASPATQITTQPQGATITAGQGFELTVTASGGNLTYQWLKNGTPINNATTATYRVQSSTIDDAGLYTCQVVGACGEETSQPATIIVQGTSVDEEAERLGLTLTVLGPIPADDVLRFSLTSKVSGQAHARLFDSKGALIGTFDLGQLEPSGSIFELPVGDIASGAYGLDVVLGGAAVRSIVYIAR